MLNLCTSFVSFWKWTRSFHHQTHTEAVRLDDYDELAKHKIDESDMLKWLTHQTWHSLSGAKVNICTLICLFYCLLRARKENDSYSCLLRILLAYKTYLPYSQQIRGFSWIVRFFTEILLLVQPINYSISPKPDFERKCVKHYLQLNNVFLHKVLKGHLWQVSPYGLQCTGIKCEKGISAPNKPLSRDSVLSNVLNRCTLGSDLFSGWGWPPS